MTTPRRYLFITGRLAEAALRRQLAELALRLGWNYDVAVMPITVAALMTTEWVARRLSLPEGCTDLVLPGLIRGNLEVLPGYGSIQIRRGPADLRELPEFFGQPRSTDPDYGAYSIEILAEINHAPRLSLSELLRIAEHYRASGADVIDLGCDPGPAWPGVGNAVAALKREGFRVSIDSFHPLEVRQALEAGAELVLSVRGSNLEEALVWAKPFPAVEVVVLPEDPHQFETLFTTNDRLREAGIRTRLDPILEPIGFGFAASLDRYLRTREREPEAMMMMGVGNLTELTDVDSAGVTATLAGFCQELNIQSVLTTEVIGWARSAVREFDIARRLMHYSIQHRVPPKKLESGLIQLRDPKVREFSPEELREFAAQLKDPNYRIFVSGGVIHLMNHRFYWQGQDPFALLTKLLEQDPELDASHAYYLGYEMAKAVTAATLGKQYIQDRALRWGHLTRLEPSERDPATT